MDEHDRLAKFDTGLVLFAYGVTFATVAVELMILARGAPEAVYGLAVLVVYPFIGGAFLLPLASRWHFRRNASGLYFVTAATAPGLYILLNHQLQIIARSAWPAAVLGNAIAFTLAFLLGFMLAWLFARRRLEAFDRRIADLERKSAVLKGVTDDASRRQAMEEDQERRGFSYLDDGTLTELHQWYKRNKGKKFISQGIAAALFLGEDPVAVWRCYQGEVEEEGARLKFVEGVKQSMRSYQAARYRPGGNEP